MDEWKRSGQIPTFGNWEHANDLPITQYFECARQAGLIRYSSSSGECGQHCIRGDHLYPSDIRKLSGHNNNLPHTRKTRLREKRGPHVKEQRKQGKGKVCDVTEPPRKQQQQQRPIKSINMSFDNDTTTKNASVARPKLTVRPPKAVDEDLYKIPPELLRSSKRKKFPGLFSCLVPACAA